MCVCEDTDNSDRFHVSEKTHNYNGDRIHAQIMMKSSCVSGKTQIMTHACLGRHTYDGAPFMCVWEDTDNDDTDRACLGRHR